MLLTSFLSRCEEEVIPVARFAGPVPTTGHLLTSGARLRRIWTSFPSHRGLCDPLSPPGSGPDQLTLSGTFPRCREGPSGPGCAWSSHLFFFPISSQADSTQTRCDILGEGPMLPKAGKLSHSLREREMLEVTEPPGAGPASGTDCFAFLCGNSSQHWCHLKNTP